jgi:hypothetical protein
MQQRRKLKPRGRPFPKGTSGNPRGRPKEHEDIKALAREHSPAAIDRLVYWMMQSVDARASVQAAGMLLDRGFGKPGQDIRLRAELSPGIAEVVKLARERVANIEHQPRLAIEHEEDSGPVALHNKEDQ